MPRRLVLSSLVLLATACSDSAPEEAPAADPTPTRIAPSDAPSDAPSEGGIEESLGSGDKALVTVVAALRRAANTDRRIDDPAGGGKKVSNWMATLHQGEVVSLIGSEGDWSKVRASDGTEGFMEKRYLAPTSDAALATNTESLKVFRRPDLLTLNTGKTIEPGSLLFKLGEKEQFSEIRAGTTTTQWVLTEKLISESKEVEAAKLLAKADWMESKKDDGHGELMSLIKEQFADSKVVAGRLNPEAAGAAEGPGEPVDVEPEADEDEARGGEVPAEEHEG